MTRTRKNQGRRGAVAPLVAILLAVAVVPILVYSINLSYLTTVKNELQSAADAAALAGSQKLANDFMKSLPPDQCRANAQAAATQFLQYYKTSATGTGGMTQYTPTIVSIEWGLYDPATGTAVTPIADDLYPSWMRITASVTINKQISAVAAAGFGIDQNGPDGLNVVTGYNAHVLPMTYDIEHWKSFVQTGMDPDGNQYTAADGSPVLQVYPSSKYKGNFGELSLDDAHAGASEIKDWVDNGLPSSAIQTLQNNGLVPTSQHPDQWDWKGNPGFKASVVMTVNKYVGDEFVIPLYKAKNAGNPATGAGYQAGVGQGSNYDYQIVGFAAVKLMPPNQVNKEVWLQPSAFYDPTLILDNLVQSTGQSLAVQSSTLGSAPAAGPVRLTH